MNEPAHAYIQLTEVITELRGDLDGTHITPNMHLDDLGLDSVERVELLTRLEDRFDVTIPQADAIHLTSVEALVRYLTVNAP